VAWYREVISMDIINANEYDKTRQELHSKCYERALEVFTALLFNDRLAKREWIINNLDLGPNNGDGFIVRLVYDSKDEKNIIAKLMTRLALRQYNHEFKVVDVKITKRRLLKSIDITGCESIIRMNVLVRKILANPYAANMILNVKSGEDWVIMRIIRKTIDRKQQGDEYEQSKEQEDGEE
jgi:hypothetical protein